MTTAAYIGLRVVAPGLNTTVQDFGRFGWQRFGVPVSGALDRMALAAANVVAGNPPAEAALECLYQGCAVQIECESVRLAVGGEGASLEVIEASGEFGRRTPALQSLTAIRGERVRVCLSGPSMSAYLAVEGGLALPLVLGSRSTYARAGLGGICGRSLLAGDMIPLWRDAAEPRREMAMPGLGLAPAIVVRVVPGPQDDRFTDDALSAFSGSSYKVTAASDRMGLRLDGARLTHRQGADIVSDGIAPGAIQVPGDGLPIIMLADRQTTGGYTKIATVISADLPALGRVGPGAELRFETVDVETAEALARAQAAQMADWPRRLVAVGRDDTGLPRLYDANLVSGVVDGTEPR